MNTQSNLIKQMHKNEVELELPTIAPVRLGVITIEDPCGKYGCQFDGPEDLFSYVSCMNHMLSLIPERDFNSAEWNCIDGWDVMTDNMGAIKYALKSGYLNEWQTALHAADDALSAGCESDLRMQEIMDFVWDSDPNNDYKVKEVDGQIIAFITEPSNKEKALTQSDA